MDDNDSGRLESVGAFDALVVGSGFAGAVLARRLAEEKGLRVLVLEKRRHIAGNMFDEVDSKGVLVHRYGPHIFRSDSDRVVSFLSRFTKWRPYQHRVLASVDGQLVPVPFNLTSMRKLMAPAKAADLERRIRETFPGMGSIPVLDLCRQTDGELAALGRFVFDKIFKNYTLKQWGMPPEELDFEATTRRVPVRLDEDDRYFQHRFQGIPLEGYTALFRRMLDHGRIQVRTGVDALDVVKVVPEEGTVLVDGVPFLGPVIWTGALDALFGHRFGPLPWRALRFEFEDLPTDRFQPVAVVNYPNEHEFTRITEFVHLTGQETEGWTTIAREYPSDYDPERAAAGSGEEPCYPILCPASAALLEKYLGLASAVPNLHLLGRLGEYRYYDMNGILESALALADRLTA